MAITENDIKLIRESWAEIEKDYETAGIILFKDYFTSFPDYIKIFAFLKTPGEDDIFKSPRFKEHMVRHLLPSISEFVNNLDKEKDLKEQLLTIGKTHREIKLNRNHFENMKHVIVKTIEIQLGPAFTPEMKEAWLKVLTAGFNIIYNTLENEEL